MVDYRSFSDAQIIYLVKEGDHAAFTELYNRYWAKLYLYARKLVNGNHNEAVDIVQDVFAYVWDKKSALIVSDSVSAYLYTAVRSKMLMQIRHSKVHDRFLSFFKDFVDKGEPVTEQYILEKELQQRVDRIVAKLPGKMRAVFILSRHEHLSRKHIAEKLNISDKTVKVQIENALKILKKKLSIVNSIYKI